MMDPGWKLKEQVSAPNLRTLESLFWYDGPRVIAVEVDGQMHIGTWSDCEEDIDRWILSPTQPEVIGSLKAGILPLRNAFTRGPSALVIDLRRDGTVLNAWRVATEDLPSTALAEEGVKLKAKS